MTKREWPVDNTLYLFHVGRTYPVLENWALWCKGSVLSDWIVKLASALDYRRNPRSYGYMTSLAQQVFYGFNPHQLVTVDGRGHLPWGDLGEVRRFVFLWPDSNGTGWTGIERQIFRLKHSSAEIVVLNGRGRRFSLSLVRWYGFRWRRFLEKTLALEIGFMLTFVLVSPCLVLWDLLRGQR